MYVFWKALRWLIGYGEFEVRGAYAERFLTLCMEKEIDMWDIRRVCPGIIRMRVFRFSLSSLEEMPSAPPLAHMNLSHYYSQSFSVFCFVICHQFPLKWADCVHSPFFKGKEIKT